MARREDLRSALGAIAVTLVMALWGGVTSVEAEEALEPDPYAEAEASAQSADDADSDDQDSGPRDMAGPRSKFQIHGFLTQAYATGSFLEGRFPNPDGSNPGPTLEEQVLGIPEDGTTDYRFLALQFRYEISPKDIMVIQLSSRSLGISPVNDLEDEIGLDWAFYEHRFASNTSVKVGRIPISFGIFNEVRDVGTILPFYRPAFVFYREGSAATEAVDGLNLSHTLAAQHDWSLDFDAYFGEWDSFDLIPTEDDAIPSRTKDSWGFWSWVNTPLFGLRWGFGFQRQNIGGGLEGIIRLPDTTTRLDSWFTSLDAAFERFVFRAEARFTENDPTFVPFLGVDDFVNKNEIFYLQFGYHPTEKFRVYLQWENFDWSFTSALFTETQDYTPRVDYGIALNYLFTPSLVLKAEYHMVEGEDSTFVPVFLQQPPFFQLQPIYSDLDDGDYTIISLSASF